MKIRAIEPQIYKQYRFLKQTNSTANKPVNKEYFTGLRHYRPNDIERKKEEQFAQDFFFGYGKVSAKECEDVIKNHPLTLTKAYKLIDRAIKGDTWLLSENPNITARAGLHLKKLLEEKYGKNYRIVSIGTSPAIVSQAAEYLGSEVIYLPISGVGKLEKMSGTKAPVGRKQDVTDIRNIRILLEYFKSKIPKNDNKVNIVIDYTSTGATLANITELLREKSGLNKENFRAYSLNHVFYREDMCKIMHDCKIQTIEQISNVPHFCIDDKINENLVKNERYDYICSKGKDFESVFWEFENYSTRLGRAYSLCMYNELKKMGLV